MTTNWRDVLDPPADHEFDDFDPGPTDEDTPIATWDRLDLTDILDGTFTPQLPELMPRTDGPALLYPGRVHSFHGESESGKSMVIQAEAARTITAGQDVLYIDFESDAHTVIGRLLEMGANPELIAKHFDYRRPEINPNQATHELRAFWELLKNTFTLAVIDGVTEALHVFGTATKDNDELTGWIRSVPKRIAHKTGAAVVLIDHVTKDADTRGRFAIGGQAKMAALDGAAYVVEVSEPLGRGLRGVVILRVAKDRPGSVRPHAGTFRKTDRTQEAARVVVDSRTAGRVLVTVEPPTTALEGQDGPSAPFRPTTLMEKASYAIEGLTEPISQREVLRRVTGREDTVLGALDILVAELYLERTAGPNRSKLYRSLRPYRQITDALSDRYEPPLESDAQWLPSDAGVTEGDASASDARPVRSIDRASLAEATTPPPEPPGDAINPDDLYGPPCELCGARAGHDHNCPNQHQGEDGW